MAGTGAVESVPKTIGGKDYANANLGELRQLSVQDPPGYPGLCTELRRMVLRRPELQAS